MTRQLAWSVSMLKSSYRTGHDLVFGKWEFGRRRSSALATEPLGAMGMAFGEQYTRIECEEIRVLDAESGRISCRRFRPLWQVDATNLLPQWAKWCVRRAVPEGETFLWHSPEWWASQAWRRAQPWAEWRYSVSMYARTAAIAVRKQRPDPESEWRAQNFRLSQLLLEHEPRPKPTRWWWPL